VRVLAAALANLGSNNAHLRGGAAVVVLNPDHTAVLARAGHDRSTLAAALVERAGNRRGVLRTVNPAFAGRGDDDDMVRCFDDPDDVLIVAGGGAGLDSMVMPSWCAGPHRNRAVSVAFDPNPSCQIPGMAERIAGRPGQ
jgi:hypothetical protein